MTTAPDIGLRGSLVRLRPRTRSDVRLMVRWYGDPDVRYWLHLSETPLPTVYSEQARFDATEEDPTRMAWIIETLDGEPIGNLSLIGIDQAHGRAELGIGIGEKDYWSRGYGTDAIEVLLRFAFRNLALRRITLVTDIDNERGIRCYEKAGFRQEGVLRGHRLRYGQPLDMVAMAALKEDWEG